MAEWSHYKSKWVLNGAQQSYYSSLVHLFSYSQITISFLSNISAHPPTSSLSADDFVSYLTEKIEAIITELPLPPVDLPNYQYLYICCAFLPFTINKWLTFLFKAMTPLGQVQSFKDKIQNSFFSLLYHQIFILCALIISRQTYIYVSHLSKQTHFSSWICYVALDN